jgi:hypothetical protein
MLDDHLLLRLAKDHQRGYQEAAARERMLRSRNVSGPDFKCLVCGKLAAILLKVGRQLLEKAKVKTLEGIPAIKSEDLRKMLENPTTNGFFI